jgi:hypothetical protein
MLPFYLIRVPIRIQPLNTTTTTTTTTTMITITITITITIMATDTAAGEEIYIS